MAFNVPKVNGAHVQAFQFSQEDSNTPFELAVYADQSLDLNKGAEHPEIRRVVVISHGHERDAWNAWSEVDSARQAAAKKGNFDPSSIAVIAPIFFNGNDKEALNWSGKGSTGRLVVWKGNAWGEGLNCQYPHEEPIVSTFDALDALLAHFSNKQLYPNVNQFVFAGHSMGGQLMHRYTVLGDEVGDNRTPPVKFCIANPSSYLYFTADRYGSAEGCTDYNQYKYGFEKIEEQLAYRPVRKRNKDYFEQRYMKRVVSHLNGLKDTGVGDDRPQALAQGPNRLERGRNWEKLLKAHGFPSTHSFDYVPGVGHDGHGIWNSDAGIKRLFLTTNANPEAGQGGGGGGSAAPGPAPPAHQGPPCTHHDEAGGPGRHHKKEDPVEKLEGKILHKLDKLNPFSKD